ncbi:MAG: RraA family protein [Steroidobacteraceae bacterium]
MSANEAAEALRRFARLDSCTLSDALDRLSLTGCVTGLLPRSVAVRVCGRVHTVKLSAGPAPATSAPPRHLGTLAIEASAAGEVIAIEQRTGIEAACWGGILSYGARQRGVAGVIADGPVRDVDEARDLAFPVFSRSVTARTARGRIHESGTDVPVQIGGVVAHPGDYVLADSSGVVFVRPDRLGEVLAAAEAIAAREAAMIGRICEGRSIAAVMGADYERMLEKEGEEHS